jgi:hypothetical protein
MSDPVTCAWCDEPAVDEVVIEPARTKQISTNTHRSSVIGLARRMPACERHLSPVGRPTPPPRKRGPIEGQMDIYDALGDEAA